MTSKLKTITSHSSHSLQREQEPEKAYVHQREFSTSPKILLEREFWKMLWQPETNVETVSSDKSWKFKGKLKAAVNLSLLHIHFSQGLLYVVLAYMTPHSASNCLINTSRKVILYSEANLKNTRCCTLGVGGRRGAPYSLFIRKG